MKATSYRLYGMPVHIDDKLCVKPHYEVSAKLQQSSPELAAQLQKWANDFFGADYSVYRMNTAAFALPTAGISTVPGHDVVIMSRHTFDQLRDAGEIVSMFDELERIVREFPTPR